jgi:hypothetical protein
MRHLLKLNDTTLERMKRLYQEKILVSLEVDEINELIEIDTVDLDSFIEEIQQEDYAEYVLDKHRF